MCSLHARIAKKFNGIFEELREEAQTDITDANMFRLKITKQRATDEFMMLKGCAVTERYQKVLGAPTPPIHNIALVKDHLDELVKILR